MKTYGFTLQPTGKASLLPIILGEELADPRRVVDGPGVTGRRTARSRAPLEVADHRLEALEVLQGHLRVPVLSPGVGQPCPLGGRGGLGPRLTLVKLEHSLVVE